MTPSEEVNLLNSGGPPGPALSQLEVYHQVATVVYLLKATIFVFLILEQDKLEWERGSLWTGLSACP